MSEPEAKLTDDQAVLLYERRLNRAIVLQILSGFAAIGVGLVIAQYLGWSAWSVGVIFVAMLAGGMLQRLIVLRVRCPRCGARALGRIHSIIQAKSVRECPRCASKLRD